MFEEIFDLPKDKTRIWDNTVPIIAQKHSIHVYITDEVMEPSEYNELCFLLRNASPAEVFTIHLNTPGGHIDSAMMIIDAINNSPAEIRAYLSGTVASAGTIIALACDSMYVAPYTAFMCHNYSHGAQGSGARVKSYVDFIDKEFSQIAKDLYTGFLTDKEIDSISTNDKEIWLNTAEVQRRLTTYIPIRKRPK